MNRLPHPRKIRPWWSRSFRVLWTAALPFWCAISWAQPPLKDGDRVVFLGDSITGELHYTRQVVDYFTLRQPGTKIHFYNVGYGGDTATRRLPRLQSDVLNLKPTVVTICYGMNDGKDTMDKFKTAMEGIVRELKRAGVRVVLLTPGCVDPDHDKYQWLKTPTGTYNDTLAQLTKEVLDLAARENVPVHNLHALMLDVLTRAKKDDPQFVMIPDGIHPDPPGHAVMTYALLKALGCKEEASGLSIDAANGKAVTDRCRVDGLKVGDEEITFTRTDEALPTGFYPDCTPVPRYIPLIEDFNQYRFRVTGLKAAAWKLVVAGMEVGTFSNQELAAGINLATRPGPWQAMAKKADDLVVKEQAEFFQRWLYLSQYPAPEHLKADLDGFIATADAHVHRLQEKRFHVADARTWKWTLAVPKGKN